ncbi:MAG TPA: hypothetical protein VFT39_23555, partial [Vicinamibacterales bacterium]|nr:hypothetical protein [Vicinamibacterales bacterium]
IVLGIAKPAAAIVLLLPGLAVVKEWAYAGATFAWVMASLSAYLSEPGRVWLVPIALLGLLAVSYFTRPASRSYRTFARASANSGRFESA